MSFDGSIHDVIPCDIRLFDDSYVKMILKSNLVFPS